MISVYNICLDAWSRVVESTLYPQVVELIDLRDIGTPEQQRLLKSHLATVICKKNIVDLLFKKVEDYTLQYLFRIPDNVTLPEDVCNLMVNEQEDEHGELERRVKNLKKEIADIRVESNLLDDEIKLAEGVLKVLKTIRKCRAELGTKPEAECRIHQ
ncbi:unnamed protein product [Anisakis simplex]|uniref:Protein MIS12 homolog n=1 Tax=Anisakis simplex TaxID=6269 RepID=A0A0M3K7V5_ANISI|nr:unnamed protein product [Anisakis simplex]